jgi:hypothetical protein
MSQDEQARTPWTNAIIDSGVTYDSKLIWHARNLERELDKERAENARLAAEVERLRGESEAARQREAEQRHLVDSLAARLERYLKGDIPDGDLLDAVDAALQRAEAAEKRIAAIAMILRGEGPQ